MVLLCVWTWLYGVYKRHDFEIKRSDQILGKWPRNMVVVLYNMFCARKTVFKSQNILIQFGVLFYPKEDNSSCNFL